MNILAKAEAWQLTCSDMGDADGIEERCLLDVPMANLAEFPDLVVVCTPLQEQIARSRFPGVPIAWMLHNGRADILPEWPIERAIALSDRVRRLHARRRPEMRIALVTPAYEPEPVGWQWGPHLWTMLSRPHTDRYEYSDAIVRLTRGMSLALEWYGQDRELGLLVGERRQRLEQCSAAYVTPLPGSAGFGLAQHECLARGVPIIGSRWGDMADEMPRQYLGLHDDPAVQRRQLERMCSPSEGPYLGRYLSKLGLDFIRSCRSHKRMESSILSAIETLL